MKFITAKEIKVGDTIAFTTVSPIDSLTYIENIEDIEEGEDTFYGYSKFHPYDAIHTKEPYACFIIKGKIFGQSGERYFPNGYSISVNNKNILLIKRGK